MDPSYVEQLDSARNVRRRVSIESAHDRFIPTRPSDAYDLMLVAVPDDVQRRKAGLASAAAAAFGTSSTDVVGAAVPTTEHRSPAIPAAVRDSLYDQLLRSELLAQDVVADNAMRTTGVPAPHAGSAASSSPPSAAAAWRRRRSSTSSSASVSPIGQRLRRRRRSSSTSTDSRGSPVTVAPLAPHDLATAAEEAGVDIISSSFTAAGWAAAGRPGARGSGSGNGSIDIGAGFGVGSARGRRGTGSSGGSRGRSGSSSSGGSGGGGSAVMNRAGTSGGGRTTSVLSFHGVSGAARVSVAASFVAGDSTCRDASSLPDMLRTPPRRAAVQQLAESPFAVSPLGAQARQLLDAPRRAPRRIAKHPFKILDAPLLQDDFYLNLMDWGPSNILAVALGKSVYLWSAATAQVTKLCSLDPHVITSVCWAPRGSCVAVGTGDGFVQVWDASTRKRIRTLSGHTGRVGTLAFSSSLLSSGSRDRSILHRDLRAAQSYTAKLTGHRQEVCGLRWSWDETMLASGGNDNKLLVWDVNSSHPMLRFNEHTAAVKAIAWSPHEHGVLCSGGGTADRCIRFYNTSTGRVLNAIDTGSQVCNLAWSKNVNEIVSTHGYSKNQVMVWRYPSMTQIATLTGHTTRVLYLAVSPDGKTIVTGAGDETLRFWNVFPGPRVKPAVSSQRRLLYPSHADLR